MTTSPCDRERPWHVQVLLDAELRAECSLLGLAPDLAEVKPEWVLCEDVGPHLALPVAPADAIDAVRAREQVRERLARLNEALAADGDLQGAASLGNYVWREHADDPDHASQGACIDLQGQATLGPLVATGALGGGSNIPPPRSRGRRAQALAARDPDFASALRLFGEAGEDHLRLWVVFEYVRDAMHGKVKAPFGFETGAVAAFCETANARGLRHKPDGRSLVYGGVDGPTARRLLRALLQVWLDRDEPR